MSMHTEERHELLVKLGDSDLTLRGADQDLRDRSVIDANGQDLGHVSALFIDENERKIRFLQVRKGGFLGIGEREFLVPREDVTSIFPEGIQINHCREHVFREPRFDPALTRARSRTFWNPYYGYYGVTPYWGAGL